jgi:hypothetical protein
MDTVTTAQTKVREAQDLYEEYREAVDNITERDLVALTIDFFLKNPNIASFTWDQYTPYFMDGEPCIFSVNTHYMRVQYLSGEVPPDAEAIWHGGDEYVVPEEGRVLLRDFCRVPEDVFLNLFGDHSEVTISNLGVVTRTEFQHD